MLILASHPHSSNTASKRTTLGFQWNRAGSSKARDRTRSGVVAHLRLFGVRRVRAAQLGLHVRPLHCCPGLLPDSLLCVCVAEHGLRAHAAAELPCPHCSRAAGVDAGHFLCVQRRTFHCFRTTMVRHQCKFLFNLELGCVPSLCFLPRFQGVLPRLALPILCLRSRSPSGRCAYAACVQRELICQPTVGTHVDRGAYSTRCSEILMSSSPARLQRCKTCKQLFNLRCNGGIS